MLELLGHGESNKAIARRLNIREGTVKVHVRHIMRRMGAANRTQVAIAASRGNGDVPVDGRGPKGGPSRHECFPDGSARDEALKRRSGSVRKALGMGPDRQAAPATDKSEQPKENQEPRGEVVLPGGLTASASGRESR